MSEHTIRPFRRTDREQLTELVNAHIAAVLPAASVSVNTVMSRLESQPGEFIVDPWVHQRLTVVAEQGRRIVAAAHLLHYADRPDVGEHYRGRGEIGWLLYWPDAPTSNPHWQDGSGAAHDLMITSLRVLQEWGISQVSVDCSLPAPACYGVTEQWPHVSRLYVDHGFAPHRTEFVLAADVAALPSRPSQATIRRTLGMSGTRLTAQRGDTELGYIEIDTNLGASERLGRQNGWADVGNLHLGGEDSDRSMINLLAAARDWLTLAGIGRLLAYADDTAEADRWCRWGFQRLTTIDCDWSR